jgi:glycosyltransferase involved in cell wall biosynthesis
LGSTPIHLIHNPVAAEFFEPPQRSKRAQLGISDEAVVFGLVAANPKDPIKGVSRTLRLLSELATLLPDQEIVVLLVGSKTKVNATGNMRVVSTGYLASSKEVAAALGLVDVFVSLSEVETAPLAVAEALALGLPVICNSAGGLIEYVDNGRNGALIKSDREFLAVAEHLAVSPQTRAEMSSRAKSFAKDRFEPQEVASKYLALYESVLSQD